MHRSNFYWTVDIGLYGFVILGYVLRWDTNHMHDRLHRDG